MIRIIGVALLVVTLCGCAQPSGTRWTPFQVAVFKPVQMAPESWDVYGLRTNLLYGSNRDVYGIDVGIWNRAEGQAAGLQAGVVNQADAFAGLQYGVLGGEVGDMTGLQAGCFSMSFVTARRLRGIQVAGVSGMTFAGDMDGIQLGTFGNKAHVMRGLQLAAIGNEVVQDAGGVQIGGIWNWNSGETKGLQIGLVNRSRSLSGLQIGLVNIHKEGHLPFFPIINIGCGGRELPPE